MLIHPYPQPRPRPLKKVGVLLLLGGILALSAVATIMAVLTVMAGICAFGSIIWWLIGKRTPKTWSNRMAPTTAAFPQQPFTRPKSVV
jgi:membrane protein DedA with SNARE-associated domain